MRVLFVGDNSDLSKKIGTALSAVGIQADLQVFNKNISKAVKTTRYDLIMLNSRYPGPIEIGLISYLRKDQVLTPILVLSAHLDRHDVISILNSGADACLDLPCQTDLLIAYTKAIIRRDQHALSAEMVHIGQLHINTGSCSVKLNEKQIPLTADEYKLLLLLAKHEGIALSKTKISKGMHNHDNHFGESNIPAVLISRIRKKFQGVTEQKYIATVYGAGYMLRAPKDA